MDASAIASEAPSTRRGLRGVVEAHPLIAFFALTFPLSWVIVPFTGGQINPLGPLLAALILSALVGGRAQVGAWLRRSFTPTGRLRWYALAIVIVVGVYSAAVGIALLAGAAVPAGEDLRAWPEILFVFPLYLVVIAATEESGWRGYAMPRLAEAHGTMKASAVLGVVIAAWHLPLVISGDQVAVVLGAIFASQFLFTWLQSRTGGSVPVVMVAHAAQGGIAGAYFGPMFTGSDETLQLSIWTGLLALVVAGIVAASRRRRGSVAPPLAA